MQLILQPLFWRVFFPSIQKLSMCLDLQCFSKRSSPLLLHKQTSILHHHPSCLSSKETRLSKTKRNFKNFWYIHLYGFAFKSFILSQWSLTFLHIWKLFCITLSFSTCSTHIGICFLHINQKVSLCATLHAPLIKTEREPGLNVQKFGTFPNPIQLNQPFENEEGFTSQNF